jgi:hypothetical protein
MQILWLQVTWWTRVSRTSNNISPFFSNHSWLRNSHRKQNFMFYYILDAQPFLASLFLPHREQSNNSINDNKEWLTLSVSRCQCSDPFPLIFLISYEGTSVTILDYATIPVFRLCFMMNYWCHKDIQTFFCFVITRLKFQTLFLACIFSKKQILITGLLSVEKEVTYFIV